MILDMPHLIIEYSDNISAEVHSTHVITHAHEVMINSGLFSLSDIRTRSHMTQDYLVGEKGKNGSFLHAIVYLMEGRTPGQKHKLSATLCEKIAECLPNIDRLSVDVRELDKSVYQKRCGIQG